MTVPGYEHAITFFNSRQPREKKLLLVLGAALLIFLDYFVIILPVAGIFSSTGTALNQVRQELTTLKDDEKNKQLIEQNFIETALQFEASEKIFVLADKFSVLLENLSKLAGTSGVKIVSLNPQEASKEDAEKPMAPVLIEISALAGTHDLGKFLTKLESDPVFFKVRELTISENTADPRKHAVNLKLEVFRRKVS